MGKDSRDRWTSVKEGQAWTSKDAYPETVVVREYDEDTGYAKVQGTWYDKSG